jgi:polysaccharide biosynthesis protein PslG
VESAKQDRSHPCSRLLPLLALLLVPLLTAAPALAAPARPVRLPLILRSQPVAPAWSPYYQGEFGYGLNTAYNAYEPKVNEMGFGYVKFYAQWSSLEPQKGNYLWNSAPKQDSLTPAVQAAVDHKLRVIIRVDYPPAWAAPGSGNRPPASAGDYADFLGALATHLRGKVAAYELWNEPNLAWEWGNQRPSPEQYAQLLIASYPRIKAADSRALVLTAGLASTGGDGGQTCLNDVDFIDRIYKAGAKGYFDALGSHPYGFANSPETRNANNVTDFQRAADQHAVMERYGDGAKKVWATEFGWLLDPAAYGHPEYINDPLWAGRQWQRVDPQTQASYLVRAYQYAHAHWPWMGVMCAFNLDFSTAPWYTAAEPMRWYSVLNPDYSVRPAFGALKAMAKPTAR